MNEAEWLSCQFSTPMLEHLRANGIGAWRKRFLLSLACSHRVASVMTPDGLRAVEVAERFVAGSATEDERWEAFVASGTSMDEANDLRTHKGDYCAYRLVQLAAERDSPATWDDDLAAWIAQTAPEAFAWTGSQWNEPVLESHRRDIAEWVRDIFGNPFRPVIFDPAWRTFSVVALAQTMYDSQSFDETPALADALARAGCDRLEILSHCWTQTHHVRGCWVVDAILGLN
jgi:hypothetical protein